MNPIKKNHDAMLRTGAMALAAAGASTAAHAATVQITFNNSFISTTSGMTTLDTDFGGDGFHDVVGGLGGGGGVVLRIPYVSGGLVASAYSAGVPIAGARVMGVGLAYGAGTQVLAVVTAFTLTDATVRGGAPTAGWLDVTATGTSRTDGGDRGRVDVHRFIFDDASGVAPAGVSHADAVYPEYGAAVPEPSGLGLLALGAGGLLARRRRAMAA